MAPVFITILLVSIAVSSAAPSLRNDATFVDCMSKCLIGGDEHEHVTAVFKICKDSPTCWGEHLGGRVQKCASECKDPAPEEVLVWTALESSSLTVSDVPEFVKCMAKCLGKSLEQVEKWYEECKTDAKCWMKKVGFQGLKCAGKCIKEDETIPMLPSEALRFSSVSDVPEFVKCMAKCLGKSLEQVEKWYEECKTNAKCWMKKAGLRAIKCAGKCIKVDETTAVAMVASDGLVEPEENSGFLVCMAKCLGKDIKDIKNIYKECKKKVKCWLKKVGKKALKCVGKCVLSETNMAKEIAVTTSAETAIEKPKEDENFGFLLCMAVCIGKDIKEIRQWYKECKRSLKCWFKKAGKKALACAGKCFLLDEQTATSTVVGTGKDVTAPANFTKCLIHCFMGDAMTIVGWYKQCGEDIDCWLKKAWEEGMKCAAKCGGNEAVSLPKKEIPPPVNNDFLNCMAHCLGEDVSKILEWYNKCHTDIQCWLKEVGFDGLKCAGKCLAEEKDMSAADSALDDPPISQPYSPTEGPVNNNFLKCMGECLKKDISEILEWYNKCHTDIGCWLKEAGGEALKCAGHCLLAGEAKDETTLESSPVNNNFLKCMGECLKKDISEILEWYNRCHTDIGCWLKEAGGEALKCAGQCLLAGEDKDETTLESSPDNNDFLNCMAHCLGKDVSEILEWFNKCHTDIKCWLKEVGFEGLKCAGECLAKEEMTLKIGPDNNDFLKCMGHCLGKDVSEILEWYNKCHTDIPCWLKALGLEGLKCAGKCLGEETGSKSVPIASQSDLVKFASYEKVIQIIKGPKGTMPSRRL